MAWLTKQEFFRRRTSRRRQIKKKENVWPSGDFLVRYFCEIF